MTLKAEFNLKVQIFPIWACPHHNSSPVLSRIADFGRGTNSLLKIPIVFVVVVLVVFWWWGWGWGWMGVGCGEWPWRSRSHLTFKAKFLISPLQEIHNHCITTREPWVLRVLRGPDCFMVSILSMYLHIPRPLHGPDCFTFSTFSMYTDLGSRGYFSN